MISDFKKKQKSNKPYYKILFILAIIFSLIIIYFLIYANIKVYQKKKELKYQLESLKNQIQEIQKSNISLQEKIQSATDDNYIEKVAREQLGWQKENENTAIFLINNNEEKNSDNKIDSKNWFANIWSAIVNVFK